MRPDTGQGRGPRPRYAARAAGQGGAALKRGRVLKRCGKADCAIDCATGCKCGKAREPGIAAQFLILCP